MTNTLHPVEQEQVMAFLDGELTAENAGRMERHLRECADCQGLAADLQGVSRQLQEWTVAAPEAGLPYAVDAALAKIKRKESGNGAGWARWRKPVWGFGIGVLAILVLSVGLDTRKRSAPAPVQSYTDGARAGELDSFDASKAVNLKPPASRRSPVGVVGGAVPDLAAPLNKETLTKDAAAQPSGPMIVQTAQLALIVNDFGAAQSQVERVLIAHTGYIAEMKVWTVDDTARRLTATLRVPAAQIDPLLTELKKLGRVESESRSGEEVTAQYIDLQARLKNARNTEQRLTQLLRDRTGKLSDVVDVEEKISEVREEIERLDAEEKSLSKRVQFATVSVSVTEEHKAQLKVVPPSIGTQFHNAAVDGYQTVADMVIGFLLFIVSWGPALLLCAAAFFVPARLAWKWKKRHHEV